MYRSSVLLTLCIALFAVATATLLFYFRRHRNSTNPIERLLSGLVPFDESLLRTIADSDDLSSEDLQQARLPLLRRNSEVLILVAEQIQELYPETLILAEDLRRTARGLAWHLDRLEAVNEGWQSSYGRTVVQCYLDAVDSFLGRVGPLSDSLQFAARQRLWAA